MTAPVFTLHLDVVVPARAFACHRCHAQFQAHIVALCYPAGTPDAGQWICPPCLAVGSTRLAQIAQALELIVVAAAGSDQALALAQQAISSLRRATEAHAIDAAARAVLGPNAHEPEVKTVAHDELAVDSGLFVEASLRDGKPWVTVHDRGGYPYLDDDAEAAVRVADKIRDLATLAELAAQLGTTG